MNKLKKLEINKLIRELEYMESDYQYKSEILETADVEFLGSVNNLVNGYPELKKIYEKKINQIYHKKIEDKIEIDQQEELEDLPTETLEKGDKIKSIYRNIVKKTHPDKVSDQELKEMYIESTKFYKNDDLISLYKVCDKLKIEYDIEEDDYFLIQNQIQKIKERIQFLENTFTWMWLNADEHRKQEVILNFVRLQIS